MSSWTTLFTIAGVHALGLAVPGPNVLAVSHTALSRSRRDGVAVAAGVAIGALVWASLAAFGVAAVLAGASRIGTGVRIAGACYLVGLGLRHVLAREPAEPRAPQRTRGSTFALLGRGLAVNLTNPKAMLFFAGVFATLLPAHAPAALRAAAVGVIVVDAAVWHTLLAVVFSTRRAARLGAAAGGPARRLVGGAFVLLGVGLAVGAR